MSSMISDLEPFQFSAAIDDNKITKPAAEAYASHVRINVPASSMPSLR